MQNVPKKKHAARRHSRILLLIFAVVLVAAAACLLIFARTPAPAPETPAHEDEEITLWDVASADITRIRIAVRNQDAWSAVQTESGALVLEGENAFTVDADIAETLLSGLKNVTAEVLSDDWNGTDEEWAAFGLDDPESVVTVDFADGSYYIVPEQPGTSAALRSTKTAGSTRSWTATPACCPSAAVWRRNATSRAVRSTASSS